MATAGKGKTGANKGVSIKGAFTLDDIPAALEAIRKQIADIKGNADEGKRTSGDLPGFGNIFKIDDASELIKAYSSVTGREEAYNRAAKDMNIVKVPAFKIDGGSAKAWKEDLSWRYNIVTKADQLKKLNEAKAELEKYSTKEHKLNNLMNNLKDIMN